MRIRNVLALLAVGLASGSAAGAPCAGFTDVDDTNQFCTNIAWMKNRGVTSGCTTTLYCPNDFVTREQMAAFMYRLGFQNAFLQGGNAFGAPAIIGTTDGQPVEVRANGERTMRFEPMISPNVVGGHVTNTVDAGVRGAVIGGGGILQGADPGFGAAAPNRVTDHYGVVGGGANNRAGNANVPTSDAIWATVAGGGSNVASGGLSTVGGGGSNTASGNLSSVAGGNQNQATATGASVAGGEFNQATATYAAVAGGQNNIASGPHAAIPGGRLNAAGGAFSFAAGRRAKANYQGAFLWADSTDLEFKVQASEFTGPGSGWIDASNTFNVRATNGVWFVTAVDPVTGRPTAGAYLTPGGSAWNVTSDAAAKQDVQAVDPQEILARALTVEVARWNYRTAPGVTHIGPMAQDFHRAFNVGSDERAIATIDADGVALAAIQGLNAKLEAKIAEQARELAAQRSAIDAQARELDALKQALESMAGRR